MQVDVGNFLRLKSCVLYTELENPDQPLINVEVVAHVTRPEFRSSEVNIYHSIFFKLFNNFDIVLPNKESFRRRLVHQMDFIRFLVLKFNTLSSLVHN